MNCNVCSAKYNAHWGVSEKQFFGNWYSMLLIVFLGLLQTDARKCILPKSDSFPLNWPPLHCKLQWGNPANIWFCLNLSLGGPIDLKVDTSELHFGCSFKVHPNNNGYTCVYVCNVYRHWCTLVGGQYCFNGYTCVYSYERAMYIGIVVYNVHRRQGSDKTGDHSPGPGTCLPPL